MYSDTLGFGPISLDRVLYCREMKSRTSWEGPQFRAVGFMTKFLTFQYVTEAELSDLSRMIFDKTAECYDALRQIFTSKVSMVVFRPFEPVLNELLADFYVAFAANMLQICSYYAQRTYTDQLVKETGGSSRRINLLISLPSPRTIRGSSELSRPRPLVLYRPKG